MTPQIDSLGFDFNAAFTNEINHFVSCCLYGTENLAPVEDGVAVMKMLNGVYQSAKLKKEIHL